MFPFEPAKNFAYGTIYISPSPGLSGTTFILHTGEGDAFPNPAAQGAYDIVVWPQETIPIITNSTIVRVTAISGDQFTFTRQSQGSNNRNIIAGDQVALAFTKKIRDDYDAAFKTGFIEDILLPGQSFIYVSTSVFRSPADKTTYFTKGRIVRFNKDSTKIAFVTGSTYNSGQNYTEVTVEWSDTVAGVPNPPANVEIAIMPIGQLGTLFGERPVDKIRFANQGAVPTTPRSGYGLLYSKTSDKKPYFMSDDGVEVKVTSDHAAPNVLKNGNFVNISTDGYGGLPDDWSNNSANPIQGGFPEYTKQQLMDLLGISSSDIKGLWNLNGNFNDLSTNGYNLSPSGSPTNDDNGLMAQAKKFVTSSSQYATVAAANAKITGSQTWITFFKSTTITTFTRIMGFMDADTTGPCGFKLDTVTIAAPKNGLISFQLNLSINSTIQSDIAIEPNKWYMLVGIYDSSVGKLKLWINGVKKEVTASGSVGLPTSNNFSIGRMGDYDGNYVDGSVQNTFILSTALTDDQVKRLWAFTTYKAVKVRRSGSDCYINQGLAQNLVERLRGKTITLRARIYQEQANTARLTIADSASSSLSNLNAIAGSWQDIYVTRTVSSTTVFVDIRLENITTNSNIWLKEVSLYEGMNLLPFEYAKDDWIRFPSLLRMDVPAVLNGYHYEENRLYDYIPWYNGFSANPTQITKYSWSGRICSLFILEPSGHGTSNAPTKTITLPIKAINTYALSTLGMVNDNGSWQSAPAHLRIDTITNPTKIDVYKQVHSVGWTASGTCSFMGNFDYPI